jgi:zinc-ribbon domain
MGEDMEFVVLLWVIFSVLAGRFAKRRGFGFWVTFLMSLMFSPILGFLSVAVRQPVQREVERLAIESGEMRKCPACAELVKAEASKCRFCGESVQPAIAKA